MEERPVLGVCLGNQLLAAVLGGEVTEGKKKEIGWYPVTLAESAKTDPLWRGVESAFTAYHWHGDIFNLPNGAVPLASSDLTVRLMPRAVHGVKLFVCRSPSTLTHSINSGSS